VSGIEQGAGELPVRQCTRATLADQIKGLYVARQAKLLNHVTRKARAEITCAGRDYDGVDVCGPKCRALQGEAAGASGKLWCMSRKAPLQGVGIDCKRLRERVYSEPARFHAVVARQHQSG
jgi:hypothetical protein